ncbi:MAG: endonuclease/exonuclease/phosphatase family protein, partial [Alistipes sp.]|nr:endonuclease/exonuclease/phosphatase family protein [Alistipes sp.]
EVRRIVDSVASQSPNMKIVVMGDMNDNPSNRSLWKILRARRNVKGAAGELYNPFARKPVIGSSRYDGRWNHFDNIILSANLVDDLSDGLKFNSKTPKKHSAYVFRRDYMCDVNGYPVPTYRGVEYVGGASDHLPVCLILER